ncbi:MAG: septum formation inhibitor Maf [Acidobacteriota bacterium]|nr:septum formation inhibitor Maf [Acidobacteriota bacterium]
MKLILASASPRRGAILESAGIAFERRATEIDESPLPGESPEVCALRLAEEKARRASRDVSGKAIVVGADTLVVLNGEVMGKPANEDEARQMLRRLSGCTHRVITGVVALRLPDGATTRAAEITNVTFAPLSAREIDDYVATGEPMDKAGAYGIQERAGRFVTRIEGCYFNVVGLPLARLCAMLRELGWDQDAE